MCHLWDSNPCGLLRPKDLKSSPLDQLGQSGNARCWDRTSDPPINSRMLWPAELTKRKTFLSDIQHSCVCVDVSKERKNVKTNAKQMPFNAMQGNSPYVIVNIPKRLQAIFPKGYRQHTLCSVWDSNPGLRFQRPTC